MKFSKEQIAQLEHIATLHLKLQDVGLNESEYNDYEFLVGDIDFLPLEI